MSTFTSIDHNGYILGGIIAPGILTAAAELHKRTAQLPHVGLRKPDKIIGTSTLECIESGVFYSGMEAARGILDKLLGEVGESARVIATGGLGEIVAANVTLIHSFEPHLVLEGARLIFEQQLPVQAGGAKGR